MCMRLRAKVNECTGKTKHSIGTIVHGTPMEIRPLPQPAWVEIVEDTSAFYLLYFDAEGVCLTDTWHETLDSAKGQAEYEFNISSTEWETVKEE